MISNLDFSKKKKNLIKKLVFSGEISWNNIRSDWAVKWLSLISIKSEKVSKICFIVICWSHPMHTGGSSPFNKKEWVIKVSSFCQSEDKQYILLALGISDVIYFPGTHPTQTATVLIYMQQTLKYINNSICNLSQNILYQKLFSPTVLKQRNELLRRLYPLNELINLFACRLPDDSSITAELRYSISSQLRLLFQRKIVFDTVWFFFIFTVNI